MILACERGRVFPQEELAARLWPPDGERPPDRLGKDLANLRNRVAELRRLLGPVASCLRTCRSASGPGGYCLERSPCIWIDLEELARLHARGRSLARQGHLAEAVQALEGAAALYRGDLLADERYAEWALELRRLWRERHVECLTHLAGCYARLGRYQAAIGSYRRILEVQPCREEAWQALMRALGASGRRAEALAVYEECREVLRQLEVAPSPETQKLAQQLRRAAPRALLPPDADPRSSERLPAGPPAQGAVGGPEPAPRGCGAGESGSEAECYQRLRRARWPQGVVCPHCGGQRVHIHGRVGKTPERRYRCLECQKTFSDRTGTIFARSKLPLGTWLQALALLAGDRGGGGGVLGPAPTREVARALGVKPETAARVQTLIQQSAVQDAVVQALLPTASWPDARLKPDFFSL